MATHSSILAWRIPWTEEPGSEATVHGVAKSEPQLRTFTVQLVNATVEHCFYSIERILPILL